MNYKRRSTESFLLTYCNFLWRTINWLYTSWLMKLFSGVCTTTLGLSTGRTTSRRDKGRWLMTFWLVPNICLGLFFSCRPWWSGTKVAFVFPFPLVCGAMSDFFLNCNAVWQRPFVLQEADKNKTAAWLAKRIWSSLIRPDETRAGRLLLLKNKILRRLCITETDQFSVVVWETGPSTFAHLLIDSTELHNRQHAMRG